MNNIWLIYPQYSYDRYLILLPLHSTTNSHLCFMDLYYGFFMSGVIDSHKSITSDLSSSKVLKRFLLTFALTKQTNFR